MIDNIINKISSYKLKISKSYRNLRNNSSSATKNIYGKGKQRIEIERLKIKLKKYYSQLGLYVARQYILKGHSDFSLDERFIILNKSIKENSLRLKKIANK